MSTKHRRSAVVPLPSLLASNPLACVLRGVLCCLKDGLKSVRYLMRFLYFTPEGPMSWCSAFPSPIQTLYTTLKPCGTWKSSTSVHAHLSSWWVASWTCAMLIWRRSIELADHYQGTDSRPRDTLNKSSFQMRTCNIPIPS